MLGPLSNNIQNKKALSGHCQQLAATQAVWAAEIWQQSPNAYTKDLSPHWTSVSTGCLQLLLTKDLLHWAMQVLQDAYGAVIQYCC